MRVDLLEDNGGRPCRCVPPKLWAVDNNLNIANVSWADFADPVDEDGVYRGLHDQRLLVSLGLGPVPGQARSRCPVRRSHFVCPRSPCGSHLACADRVPQTLGEERLEKGLPCSK